MEVGSISAMIHSFIHSFDSFEFLHSTRLLPKAVGVETTQPLFGRAIDWTPTVTTTGTKTQLGIIKRGLPRTHFPHIVSCLFPTHSQNQARAVTILCFIQYCEYENIMLLTRWLTSALGMGCSGPPPTGMRIRVECNHMPHELLVQGLEASFPSDTAMVQVSRTEDSYFVGMFHCCFCPPGTHNDNELPWFNVTAWESELTQWAQDVWENVEHCAIVIEPHAVITSS